MRRLVLALLALCLAACRDPAPGPRAPSPESRAPNIVLVTIDTLRADRLTPELMPAVSAIAAHGARFTNARTVVPLTLPAHVSLMTGALPPAHGVRENGLHRFDGRMATVADVLRARGYDTAAFVGAYVLDRRFGLDRGFATYDDRIPRDPAATDRLQAERRGDEVTDAAIAWLRSRSTSTLDRSPSPKPQAPSPESRAPSPEPRVPSPEPRVPSPEPQAPSAESRAPSPFFLWLHLYDPHAPYAPPAGFLQKAGGRAYDGEVAFADAQVGRLVAAIDAAGLRDRTAIVVAGDHGESLGEHGEQTHGMLLYDGALRVPLVVTAPGVGASTRGEAVSLIDLTPTLLALADAAVPGTMTGRNLLAAAAPHEVFAETEYPRVAGWSPLGALADERWKLIRSSETELYDLAADPGETRNLARDRGSIAQAMDARLATLGATTTAPPSAAPAADVAERLRALGYVASAPAPPTSSGTAPNPAHSIPAWTTFESALAELNAARPARAAAILRPLVGAHPSAPLFATTYAQALAAAGQPRAALPIFRRLVTASPRDGSLYHELAVAARDAGRADEAERAERAAIALDPALPAAHNGLGLVMADRGRDLDAVTAFAEAVKLDATNAGYWTNLGNARRATGDPGGAEAAYREALGRDASYGDAANGLGVLLVQSGRARDAVALFEPLVARDPSFVEARLNYGIALQQSGQAARAADEYRRVLKAPARYARERRAAAALLEGMRQ